MLTIAALNPSFIVPVEIITSDDPFKFFSEHIVQHDAATRRVDLENCKVAFAVPGLVDVQDSRGFQLAKQVFVQ